MSEFVPFRYPQSHFDDIAACVARTFERHDYAASEPTSAVFTLRVKYIEDHDTSEHAWYLSHVHCALVCKDHVVALRAYGQACKIHKRAVGPFEHDALTAAQQRIEDMLRNSGERIAS